MVTPSTVMVPGAPATARGEVSPLVGIVFCFVELFPIFKIL